MQRYNLKVAFFLYKRKLARWITLYNNVNSLIQKPIPEEAFKKVGKRTLEDEETGFDEQHLILQPIPNNRVKVIGFRVLSVLSFILCLIVIVTEATVIFNYEYTLLYFVSF